MPDTEYQHVILFDGVCNLCERSVQLVIRNDRAARFKFASLQSPAAARLLSPFGAHDGPLSSVVLIERARVYRKSRAALRIARHMDHAWPMLYYLFYWIPPLIADRVYDFIGNRRYRWFGRKQVCWLPSDEQLDLFLDASEANSTQVSMTDGPA